LTHVPPPSPTSYFAIASSVFKFSKCFRVNRISAILSLPECSGILAINLLILLARLFPAFDSLQLRASIHLSRFRLGRPRYAGASLCFSVRRILREAFSVSVHTPFSMCTMSRGFATGKARYSATASADSDAGKAFHAATGWFVRANIALGKVLFCVHLCVGKRERERT
jgi:hypothetical protein